MKSPLFSVSLAVVSVGILVSAVSVAGHKSSATSAPIPNLIGTWIVSAEGAALPINSNSGGKPSPDSKFFTFRGEATIQAQDGRRVAGILTSGSNTERFVGVIGIDGKTFTYVDETGSLSGQIASQNAISASYSHFKSNEKAVSSGTWIRKQ
mgnify:FL=1|jgi:hypothetical protein